MFLFMFYLWFNSFIFFDKKLILLTNHFQMVYKVMGENDNKLK